MANSLGIDLKDGDIVLIKKKHLKKEYHDPEKRRFQVSGGFGMSSVTGGTALFGTFLYDGEHCRMNGFDIECLVDEDK